MGPDAPAPVLVYDRIDANRRNTRLLLGVYVLALLPFVSEMIAWMAPWMIIYVAVPLLTAAQRLGMRLSLDAIDRAIARLTALGLSENAAFIVMSLTLEVLPGLVPVAGIAAMQ